MTTRANKVFKYYRPDEVAECFPGIDSDLYGVLWGLMEDLPPQPNLEDMCPQNMIGEDSLASMWKRLTEDNQKALNKAAKLQVVERFWADETAKDDEL